MKFRIWSKKYKLFTSDSRWPSNQHHHEEFLLTPTGEVWRLVTADSEDYFRDLNSGEFVVQQFTGIKDKNGKDIYEGDILSNVHVRAEGNDANIGMVFFAAGAFMINGDGPLYDQTYSHSPDLLTDHAVIGNIFENPELLK